MQNKPGAALFWAIALSGCGSDPTDLVAEPDGHKSFEDFTLQIASAAGNNAVHCGTLAIDEAPLVANTCVAEAFALAAPFYAIYRLQGIDSQVAEGVSGGSDGTVRFWSYDSNPGGGLPAAPGVIVQQPCLNAALSGTLDAGYRAVFSCDT